MHNKNHGYILLIVLLFIQAITLLSLYSLQNVWMEYKINQYDLHRLKNINLLKHVMNIIEQQLQETIPSCVIQTTSTEIIKSHSLDWWKTTSCTGIFQSIQYYYVLEALGDDSCAHIVQTKTSIAEYYRVTLLGLYNDNESRLLLQSTFIKASPQHSVCDGVIHPVRTGQQTLLELI
jgi:Tfp pilus assembly protein PilX